MCSLKKKNCIRVVSCLLTATTYLVSICSLAYHDKDSLFTFLMVLKPTLNGIIPSFRDDLQLA